MLRYMLTGLPPGLSHREHLEKQGILLPLLKASPVLKLSPYTPTPTPTPTSTPTHTIPIPIFLYSYPCPYRYPYTPILALRPCDPTVVRHLVLRLPLPPPIWSPNPNPPHRLWFALGAARRRWLRLRLRRASCSAPPS